MSRIDPFAEEQVGRVRAALRQHLSIEPDRLDLELSYSSDDSALTMRGEVPDIAVKKRALAIAAAVPGVRWVADRLRVTPALPMGDGAIRDHVRDALAGEPALSELAIFARDGERLSPVLDPPAPRGRIEFEIKSGIVLLHGSVPSLTHKRLSAVLCWWVPGTRDVVNDLGVDPPEQDSDGEIADAVRLVLEKDPFIDAVWIGVTCEGGVVTLRGSVRSHDQEKLAERDAWFTFGVSGVVSELTLSSAPGAPAGQA